MSDSAPGDRLEDRVGTSRYWLGFLIGVDRWLLAAAILLAAFLALAVTSQLGLTPLRRIATTQNGLRYLFSPFIGAIITGTSIVVTINQLVLSQELGAVGDQRNRMNNAVAFRTDIETLVDEAVSPPEPAAFLDGIVGAIRRRATRLDEQLVAEDSADGPETVDRFVEEIRQNADMLSEELSDAQFGTFGVLRAALDFNYSWKIYETRRLRERHGESLSTEATDTFEELIDLLEAFGVAREHFKTLYFQWALIDLSRALLYIAVPALVVIGALVMYVDATTIYGATLGVDNLVWLSSAGFTVGLAPFVVFTVYILRIATVAKHTLAMGPFILRETSREVEFE
ncbi:MAG: hypothetical protein ACOC0Z_05255 [Halohasta sp.]